MKLLVTAGPTREPIDAVRFITNASSGQMGYAVAAAGVAAGMEVTLLSGPVALAPPEGCQVVPFVTVADLKALLVARFDACDALVMGAAVGDFTVQNPSPGKLHRSDGPIRLTLLPTDDLLAALTARKRTTQRIVAFAVEEGLPERTSRPPRPSSPPRGPTSSWSTRPRLCHPSPARPPSCRPRGWYCPGRSAARRSWPGGSSACLRPRPAGSLLAPPRAAATVQEEIACRATCGPSDK